jgi:hypothetical protein
MADGSGGCQEGFESKPHLSAASSRRQTPPGLVGQFLVTRHTCDTASAARIKARTAFVAGGYTVRRYGAPRHDGGSRHGPECKGVEKDGEKTHVLVMGYLVVGCWVVGLLGCGLLGCGCS